MRREEGRQSSHVKPCSQENDLILQVVGRSKKKEIEQTTERALWIELGGENNTRVGFVLPDPIVMNLEEVARIVTQ